MRHARRFAFLSVGLVAICCGCATKTFTRTETARVNDRVDALARAAEETQERTRQTEARIAELDQMAAGVSQSSNATQAEVTRLREELQMLRAEIAAQDVR